MTLRALEAQEGRPPTTIDGLSRALLRARTRNVDLVGELLEERRCSVALAQECRARGHRIHLATVAERPDLAAHEGLAVVAAAERFLGARGGKAA